MISLHGPWVSAKTWSSLSFRGAAHGSYPALWKPTRTDFAHGGWRQTAARPELPGQTKTAKSVPRPCLEPCRSRFFRSAVSMRQKRMRFILITLHVLAIWTKTTSFIFFPLTSSQVERPARIGIWEGWKVLHHLEENRRLRLMGRLMWKIAVERKGSTQESLD